jgi:hypothetical protein
MRYLARTFSLILLACAGLTINAQAEPFVIANGAGGASRPLINFYSFSYSNAGGSTAISFSADAIDVNSLNNRCSPCAPGSTLNLGFSATGSSLRFGRITRDGVTYPFEPFSGFFAVLAPTVTLPTTGGSISYRVPITFGGTITPGPSPPIFSLELSGSGEALVQFIYNSNGNFYEVASVRYEAPVLTPEPATWLLLGTGIAGVVAVVRKKRGA